MSAVPWSEWLYTAARQGVAPAAFWRLSVIEWLALIAPHGVGGLSRAELERLMRLYPDE